MIYVISDVQVLYETDSDIFKCTKSMSNWKNFIQFEISE